MAANAGDVDARRNSVASTAKRASKGRFASEAMAHARPTRDTRTRQKRSPSCDSQRDAFACVLSWLRGCARVRNRKFVHIPSSKIRHLKMKVRQIRSRVMRRTRNARHIYNVNAKHYKRPSRFKENATSNHTTSKICHFDHRLPRLSQQERQQRGTRRQPRRSPVRMLASRRAALQPVVRQPARRAARNSPATNRVPRRRPCQS